MDRPSQARLAKFAILSRTLMIVSGLFLLAFATSHLINLIFGLISVDLMDTMRPYLSGVWSSTPLKILLTTALTVHFVLALRMIYFRETLFSSNYDTIQLLAGIVIVPLLIPHILGTMTVKQILGDASYRYQLYFFWIISPQEGLRQVALIVALWTHGTIGLFTWLSLKFWAARAMPWLYPLAVLIPTLALIGYVEGGRQILIENDPNRARVEAGEGYGAAPTRGQRPPAPDYARFPPPDTVLDNGRTVSEVFQAYLVERPWAIRIAWALIILTFAARMLRRWLKVQSGRLDVAYASGITFSTTSGASLLDISRKNDVPHANICRGRGRCGTCQVRVLHADPPLPAPQPLEQATLDRIGADKDVRLACQVFPIAGQLEIERLVSPEFSLRPRRAYLDDEDEQGDSAEVTA